MKRRVVIVGAGVSGLTVAYELAERSHRYAAPVDVICLEASERSGGNIRSERERDFLCEWGPNGFLDNSPCTLTLVRRLGLEDRLVRAQPTSRSRFVFRAGKLRRVPTGPAAFLLSDILSPFGKLRLGLEPIVPRRRAEADESVFGFARRRIGGEAARVLVDAMVSGLYGGDARQLSLGATFPRMRAMEQKHGSLFRAMLAERGGDGGGPAGPGGKLTSFRNGMQELVDALTREAGERVRYRVGVRSVSDMGLRGFRVHLDEGAPMDVDAVVIACPAWSAAPILSDMDPEMSQAAEEVPSAPLVVVQSGYRKAALGDPPEGFGFLVPRKQGARILGTIWSSNVFPGRAPDGSVLFTTMLGGAHDPQAIDLGDRELSAAVGQDLTRIMGIATQPHFSKVIRHPRGIPQYTVGHLDRLERMAAGVGRHPGLWVSGNSYRGISVNACVEEAPQIAEAALEFLAQQSREHVVGNPDSQRSFPPRKPTEL